MWVLIASSIIAFNTRFRWLYNTVKSILWKMKNWFCLLSNKWRFALVYFNWKIGYKILNAFIYNHLWLAIYRGPIFWVIKLSVWINTIKFTHFWILVTLKIPDLRQSVPFMWELDELSLVIRVLRVQGLNIILIVHFNILNQKFLTFSISPLLMLIKSSSVLRLWSNVNF